MNKIVIYFDDNRTDTIIGVTNIKIETYNIVITNHGGVMQYNKSNITQIIVTNETADDYII